MPELMDSTTLPRPGALCTALHCPQQVEKIVLDYDDESLITIFDQTAGTKTVYEGAEVRQRTRTPNKLGWSSLPPSPPPITSVL